MRRRLTRAESVLAKTVAGVVQDQASCPVCRRTYRTTGIHFAGHRRDAWLYLAACGHCSSVAIISAQTGGGVCRVSELAHSGGWNGQAAAAVTRDDVARLRRTLEGFDGDFARLFST